MRVRNTQSTDNATEHKRNKNNKDSILDNHIVGKVIVLIQLLVTVVFMARVMITGLVPTKYIVILVLVLLIDFGACLALQFLKNKVNLVGIIVSLITSVILLVAIFYVNSINKMFDDVGGAENKTDNMVVIVRMDDAAANLQDTKDYTFAIQTSVDTANTQLMVDSINTELGKNIETVTYNSLQEALNGLLTGETDAAIYNEAFNGTLEEQIENFSEKIKVVHRYGITSEVVVEDEKDPEAEIQVDQPFNIYISGIDVAGEISATSRSDVNIIVSVNPTTKKILLTTTPRDYYVEIPGISGGAKDKLTHAGIYGVDASINTLEAIYDIEISYYARVNFTSLVNIVDALGGVDVVSDYTFSTTKYSFVEGINHLNGEQALAFSRERYSFEDGDNQRGRNQEAVLTAILKKVMTPAILTKGSQIIASVSDSVETNMTKDEMTKFINMQIDHPSQWDIQSVAAQGTGDQQDCYSIGANSPKYVMQPDWDSVEQIKEKMQSVLKTNDWE